MKALLIRQVYRLSALILTVIFYGCSNDTKDPTLWYKTVTNPCTLIDVAPFATLAFHSIEVTAGDVEPIINWIGPADHSNCYYQGINPGSGNPGDGIRLNIDFWVAHDNLESALLQFENRTDLAGDAPGAGLLFEEWTTDDRRWTHAAIEHRPEVTANPNASMGVLVSRLVVLHQNLVLEAELSRTKCNGPCPELNGVPLVYNYGNIPEETISAVLDQLLDETIEELNRLLRN